ncbi:MAG: DUF2442 domain-containing protein [Ignavibacteriota bacterium]
MSHPIHKVISFEHIAPFVLRLRFEDKSEQTIDFKPVLGGEVYGQLLDISLFKTVHIEPNFHTLEWYNGADFNPNTLHDWPAHLPGLIEQTMQWEKNMVLEHKQK